MRTVPIEWLFAVGGGIVSLIVYMWIDFRRSVQAGFRANRDEHKALQESLKRLSGDHIKLGSDIEHLTEKVTDVKAMCEGIGCREPRRPTI